MKAREIPKIPLEQLTEEVAQKIKEITRFRIALAFVLDGHNIPVKMWPWYALKIGTALNKRKQFKKQK